MIKGFPTDPLKNDLNNIWKVLRRVRMLSHPFDLSRVETESKKVRVGMTRLDQEITRLAPLSGKCTIWGGITILVFIGFGILTFLYNKQSMELD